MNPIIDSHAAAVRDWIAGAALPAEWPDCRRYLMTGAAELPATILALPVISCLAVGGETMDGVQTAAGWLALNTAFHLLDAVEDGDFTPDGSIDTPEKALNLSTGLLCVAFHFFAATPSPGGSARVVKACAECGYRSAQGQHLGFDPAPGALDQAIHAYWQGVILKSGSLFRMACAGGASAGTDSPQLIDALGEYGAAIGVLLQLVDDCRDMLDENTGKREITLPVLLFSQTRGEQGIVQPDSRASLQGSGVPEAITAAMMAWFQNAVDSLKSVGPSEASAALEDILHAILGVPFEGGDR